MIRKLLPVLLSRKIREFVAKTCMSEKYNFIAATNARIKTWQ